MKLLELPYEVIAYIISFVFPWPQETKKLALTCKLFNEIVTDPYFSSERLRLNLLPFSRERPGVTLEDLHQLRVEHIYCSVSDRGNVSFGKNFDRNLYTLLLETKRGVFETMMSIVITDAKLRPIIATFCGFRKVIVINPDATLSDLKYFFDLSFPFRFNEELRGHYLSYHVFVREIYISRFISSMREWMSSWPSAWKEQFEKAICK